ncbi:hypothetical protein KIN20_009040, partial [Parelaphostrongylus tenuis]
ESLRSDLADFSHDRTIGNYTFHQQELVFWEKMHRILDVRIGGEVTEKDLISLVFPKHVINQNRARQRILLCPVRHDRAVFASPEDLHWFIDNE